MSPKQLNNFNLLSFCPLMPSLLMLSFLQTVLILTYFQQQNQHNGTMRLAHGIIKEHNLKKNEATLPFGSDTSTARPTKQPPTVQMKEKEKV